VTKFVKIAGITAVVVALVAGSVAVIAAQEPDESKANWALNLRERIHEAIADALGITVDQYDAAVDSARADVLEQAVEEGILTQEQAERIGDRVQEGFGPFFGGGRLFGGGPSLRGRMGPMGGVRELHVVAADELGMTQEELRDELLAGKSIAELAEEKNVDLQTITDAFLAVVNENLVEAVEDGYITQEQADQMLEHMEEAVAYWLEAKQGEAVGGRRAWPGCFPGGSWRGGARGGGFMRFPGQTES
jgi:hypothetical protein